MPSGLKRMSIPLFTPICFSMRMTLVESERSAPPLSVVQTKWSWKSAV
ncbi:hypothetical protein ACEQPO_23835 [Bacillus sp. SL00103]